MAKEFRVGNLAPAPSSRRPLLAAATDRWSALLPPVAFPNVTELGSGACTLAPWIFSRPQPPAPLSDFESDTRLAKNFRSPNGLAPGSVSLTQFQPALGLSLPDASQDLLITNRYLEFLRMEELYMTCHEARRVVKMGGHWAIASLTPAPHTFARFWQKLRAAGQPLELTHYISPEDWRLVTNEKVSQGGIWIQYVLLERVPG